MKRTRFTEEQIIGLLKEAGAGAKSVIMALPLSAVFIRINSVYRKEPSDKLICRRLHSCGQEIG